MKVIDYDQIDEWGPWIGVMVAEIASSEIGKAILESEPVYLEDAGAFLCDRIGRGRLIEHLAMRLAPYAVRMYHGTRVTDAELESIRTEGLKPLKLVDRKPALAAIFGEHPKWAEAKPHFEAVLHKFGPGEGAGPREDNCVHFCFSRTGLVRGCNHYLTHGAEVDRHIVHHLFGDEIALDLLRTHRRAKLVTFLSPFPKAAQAANPWGFPSEDLPSLLGMLINAWGYRQAHPAFTVVSQRDCTAARFEGPILASQIERIVDVDDIGLDRDQR